MDKPNRTALVIALVEDEPYAQRGTRSILEEHGYSLSEERWYTNREEAETGLASSPPQLLLADVQIPRTAKGAKTQQQGLELIEWVLTQLPDQTRIVALTKFEEAWAAYRLAALGVSLIHKVEMHAFLPSSIESVMQGLVVYSPTATSLIKVGCDRAVRAELEALDIQILRGVAANQTDYQIGQAISLGEDAVGARLKKMFKMFGLNDRHLLMAWYRDYVAPLRGIPFG